MRTGNGQAGQVASNHMVGKQQQYGIYVSPSAPPQYAPPPAPTRDTIQLALDEQEKATNELHNELSALTDRLTLVLASPGPVDGTGQPGASVPPVLDRIRYNTCTVLNAIQRVRDLTNRALL